MSISRKKHTVSTDGRGPSTSCVGSMLKGWVEPSNARVGENYPWKNTMTVVTQPNPSKLVIKSSNQVQIPVLSEFKVWRKMESLKIIFEKVLKCETVWFVVDFVSFMYFIGHLSNIQYGNTSTTWALKESSLL